MTKDILIVVRHGPYGGFQAAEALRHANGSISLGFRPIVVLVDDGVYLAKEGQEPNHSQWLALSETFDEVIARGLYEKKDAPAEFYVEEESLLHRFMNPGCLKYWTLITAVLRRKCKMNLNLWAIVMLFPHFGIMAFGHILARIVR